MEAFILVGVGGVVFFLLMGILDHISTKRDVKKEMSYKQEYRLDNDHRSGKINDKQYSKALTKIRSRRSRNEFWS